MLKPDLHIVLSQKRVNISVNDYILHSSIFAETLKKVAGEERKVVFCLKELVLN